MIIVILVIASYVVAVGIVAEIGFWIVRTAFLIQCQSSTGLLLLSFTMAGLHEC